LTKQAQQMELQVMVVDDLREFMQENI